MRYVVKLGMEDALALGIVHCECGHPPNNHFLRQDGIPCAHCSCNKFRPWFSIGKSLITIKSFVKSILQHFQDRL